VAAKFAALCEAAGTPKAAILPLRTAIAKAQPAPGYLTAMHKDYVCLPCVS
jgi:hypothetical protein